jgi:hypothetical protein
VTRLSYRDGEFAIPPPLFVSPRLMVAVQVFAEVGTIHLEIAGRNIEGRITTRCVVEDNDGRELYVGDGPSSACGAEPDYLELMRSTISFIAHDGEGYRRTMSTEPPEDGWGFNGAVAEWAYMNDNELAMTLDEEGDQ